jgi:adenine/guanine phosphoribosyltransferase-like PRPP-binding protein
MAATFAADCLDATVIGAAFLIELAFLKGRARLASAGHRIDPDRV